MSKTVSASRVPVAAHPALGVRLILGAIAFGVLARPALLLWAEHVDGRFAEEPMGTVSQLSLVFPVVLVPISVVAALIAHSWQLSEPPRHFRRPCLAAHPARRSEAHDPASQTFSTAYNPPEKHALPR